MTLLDLFLLKLVSLFWGPVIFSCVCWPDDCVIYFLKMLSMTSVSRLFVICDGGSLLVKINYSSPETDTTRNNLYLIL